MMAALRAFAKSPFAAVLMGLLIVSFGIWGVRDVFHVRISDAVVKAGSREIRSAEFKQRFTQQLQQYQQQTGQAVTVDQAAQQGVVQQALEDMANEEAMLEAIRRSGIQASDQLVLEQVRKIPAFFNPVTGAFDEDSYERLLGSRNLTPVQFQQDLRDQLSMVHFTSALAAGLKAPAIAWALIRTRVIWRVSGVGRAWVLMNWTSWASVGLAGTGRVRGSSMK